MKTPLNQAFVALALMGVLGGAQADTVQLDYTAPPYVMSLPYDLGANPTDANAYSVTHAATFPVAWGYFHDIYTFTLPDGGDVIGSASSHFLPSFERHPHYLLNVSLSLFSDASNTGWSGGFIDTELGKVDFGWGSSNLLAFDDLPAGNYYWSIAGEASGLIGGQYLFAVNTMPAIPEASSYALMLAGLGLLGLKTRYRSDLISPSGPILS